MSLFEEYLLRGPWLAESERIALYKFLLKSKLQKYKKDSTSLLKDRVLTTSTANAEIYYSINSNLVECKVRKIGEIGWNDPIRSLKTSRLNPFLKRKLTRFFAQTELDTLRNFPIQAEGTVDEKSFAINVYPYYELNYYSNGNGKVRGFFKKVLSHDDPLLEQLLAS